MMMIRAMTENDVISEPLADERLNIVHPVAVGGKVAALGEYRAMKPPRDTVDAQKLSLYY